MLIFCTFFCLLEYIEDGPAGSTWWRHAPWRNGTDASDGVPEPHAAAATTAAAATAAATTTAAAATAPGRQVGDQVQRVDGTPEGEMDPDAEGGGNEDQRQRERGFEDVGRAAAAAAGQIRRASRGLLRDVGPGTVLPGYCVMLSGNGKTGTKTDYFTGIIFLFESILYLK